MTIFDFKNYHIIYHANNISHDIKVFIEANHYSKTARSLKPMHVFTLWYDDLLVGVTVYGQPCGKGTVSVHGINCVELRRVCLVDEAPKNSESWFISRTLKQLKKFNIPKVISYADPEKGHSGVIYRALNFKYLGQSKSKNCALQWGKQQIHTRQVYQKKSNGDYHAKATFYQSLMKTGKAKLVPIQPKHIYVYDL